MPENPDSEPESELVLLGQAGYSNAAIDFQVDRLCKSSALDGQDLPRRILRYLVAEALAGRVPHAADIAEQCGRQDFSSDDSYVRRATNRLREMLSNHYEQYAEPDEIRLEVPLRSYYVLAPQNLFAETHHPGSPVASIVKPEELADVYQRVTVTGQIDVLNPDLRVWLVVLAPDGFYYPQCRVSRQSPSWTYDVRIGRLGWGATDGMEFCILLVAADVDGDFEFHAYVKRCGDGFGTRLPADMEILATRRVIRRDIRPGT